MEILDVAKKVFRRDAASLLLFWVFGFSFALPASDVKMDYASTQRDILRFEAAVDVAINSTFSASPFAVVQKTKGAYLQGYGISFAFLVNIHRAVVSTPFGEIRSRARVTPDLKRQRIEELKEKLIRVLQDNGSTFRQLRNEDHIAIVAFIEDRNFPDEPSTNRTIVMSVLKKDLDELGHRDDRLQEFKQRMKIVEY